LPPPLETEEVIVMRDYEIIMVILTVIGLLIAVYKRKDR